MLRGRVDSEHLELHEIFDNMHEILGHDGAKAKNDERSPGQIRENSFRRSGIWTTGSWRRKWGC